MLYSTLVPGYTKFLLVQMAFFVLQCICDTGRIQCLLDMLPINGHAAPTKEKDKKTCLHNSSLSKQIIESNNVLKKIEDMI